ncbi:MAG: hypothetical protein AAFU70_11585, partial [Planctomycetota bacterium]
SFRRRGAASRVPGLYLAGGSVHPGPGVPMVLMSGVTAGRAVCEDLGVAPKGEPTAAEPDAIPAGSRRLVSDPAATGQPEPV